MVEERRRVVEHLGTDLGRPSLDRAAVHTQSGECHRAVDVDGDVRQFTLVVEVSEMVQQDLGAIDGERRDHHGATPIDRATDRVAQQIRRVRVVVQQVAVGALDHDPVGVADRLGGSSNGCP
jgi:hypothetical protein